MLLRVRESTHVWLADTVGNVVLSGLKGAVVGRTVSLARHVEYEVVWLCGCK